MNCFSSCSLRKPKQTAEFTLFSVLICAKNVFFGVRYQKVINPLFARYIGSKRLMWMYQSPPLPYLHIPRLSLANISLQSKLFRTRSRPMDTQSAIFLFLKENVCRRYSLEAALSNVNDSFTISRLMKRPKTVCDRTWWVPTITFFVKYTESFSTMFKPIRRRTPTLFTCFKNAVHLYFIGSNARVVEVVNNVDYESASNISRYI